MNTVGPAISTISISRPASDRFSSDSRRTPLSSPVTTEMVASRGGGDDQADLHRNGHRQAVEVVQPGVDLGDTQAERGSDAEHRADDGEDVHRVPDGTVDALADQRVERRAQCQRQAVTVGEVSEDHRHDGVDRRACRPQ